MVVGNDRMFISVQVVPEFEKLAAVAKAWAVEAAGPSGLIARQDVATS
jgi:hypothetical protein